MTKSVTFVLVDADPSHRDGEIQTLPEAIKAAQSTRPGEWIFNLSKPPSLDYPLINISVAGLDLVTNRIAGVLGAACDNATIRGPNGVTSIKVDRSSLRAAETSIYSASADMCGRPWLVRLAGETAPILHQRQLRLELLHCVALRLCESEALAELGKLIDLRLSSMALNPNKATGPASVDRGLH